MTAIAIANRALALLGQDAVSSFDENSQAARLARQLWPMVRDDVLSSYQWNRALVKARLVADAVPPAFGYAFAYALPEGPEPAAALRVLRVEGASRWEVVGRHIHCDLPPPLDVAYIGRLEDERRLGPALATGLAYALAAAMALSLTGSIQAAAQAGDMAERKLREAKRRDAQEGEGQELEATDWLAARSNGYPLP